MTTTGFYERLPHWKYRVTEKQSIYIRALAFHHAEIRDRRGRLLAQLRAGTLTVLPGFCWDGSSDPTIDTPNFMLGSLFRAALYQLFRIGQLPRSYRGVADALMRKVNIAEGMSYVRAWIDWAGVRVGGKQAAQGPAVSL